MSARLADAARGRRDARAILALASSPGRHDAPAAATVLLATALAAAVLLALPAGRALAQARPGLAADEPPPPDVSAADLMESARSEVRVIAKDNHEVEEYAVGNNVYMVKVKPKNAPPYYLIDEDGSGNLQWKRGSDLERTSVPHWAVIRW